MGAKAKPKPTSHRKEQDSGRAQVVFIVVGICIILGGLWLLYSAGGPYHPGGETQVYLSDG